MKKPLTNQKKPNPSKPPSCCSELGLLKQTFYIFAARFKKIHLGTKEVKVVWSNHLIFYL